MYTCIAHSIELTVHALLIECLTTLLDLDDRIIGDDVEPNRKLSNPFAAHCATGAHEPTCEF
jgi:hypothetical protein